ncbi:MAG: hypothetical protein AAFV33_22730, partial [Chloroflexota bacterium]
MPEDQNPNPDAHDDDVPFHLPKADDYDDYAAPDEDTGDMPAYTAPSQSILDDAPRRDAHNMPTMPIPREPGMPNPNKTVTSTGSEGTANTMRSNPVRPEDVS